MWKAKKSGNLEYLCHDSGMKDILCSDKIVKPMMEQIIADKA